jgi:hypothetical protein
VLQVQSEQQVHKVPQVLVIYPDPKALQEQQVLDTEDLQVHKGHKGHKGHKAILALQGHKVISALQVLIAM